MANRPNAGCQGMLICSRQQRTASRVRAAWICLLGLMLRVALTRHLLTPTNLFVVVQSLSGLQSSVECVVFGEREDTIAAGGANGTVKVWDMESGKGRHMVHRGTTDSTIKQQQLSGHQRQNVQAHEEWKKIVHDRSLHAHASGWPALITPLRMQNCKPAADVEWLGIILTRAHPLDIQRLMCHSVLVLQSAGAW